MKGKRIKKIAKRFSDFILGFLAGLIVITLGRHAMAAGIDNDVNIKLKEEYIRIEAAQKRATLQILKPRPIENEKREDGPLAIKPVLHDDSLIGHRDDISAAEQSEYIPQPRAGVAKKYDPLDAIEQNIAEEQALQLYREHYRGAVKSEVIERARRLGLNPSNSMAEEITARAVDGQFYENPSSGSPQN